MNSFLAEPVPRGPRQTLSCPTRATTVRQLFVNDKFLSDRSAHHDQELDHHASSGSGDGGAQSHQGGLFSACSEGAAGSLRPALFSACSEAASSCRTREQSASWALPPPFPLPGPVLIAPPSRFSRNKSLRRVSSHHSGLGVSFSSGDLLNSLPEDATAVDDVVTPSPPTTSPPGEQGDESPLQEEQTLHKQSADSRARAEQDNPSGDGSGDAGGGPSVGARFREFRLNGQRFADKYQEILRFYRDLWQDTMRAFDEEPDRGTDVRDKAAAAKLREFGVSLEEATSPSAASSSQQRSEQQEARKEEELPSSPQDIRTAGATETSVTDHVEQTERANAAPASPSSETTSKRRSTIGLPQCSSKELLPRSRSSSEDDVVPDFVLSEKHGETRLRTDFLCTFVGRLLHEAWEEVADEERSTARLKVSLTSPGALNEQGSGLNGGGGGLARSKSVGGALGSLVGQSSRSLANNARKTSTTGGRDSRRTTPAWSREQTSVASVSTGAAPAPTTNHELSGPRASVAAPSTSPNSEDPFGPGFGNKASTFVHPVVGVVTKNAGQTATAAGPSANEKKSKRVDPQHAQILNKFRVRFEKKFLRQLNIAYQKKLREWSVKFTEAHEREGTLSRRNGKGQTIVVPGAHKLRIVRGSIHNRTSLPYRGPLLLTTLVLEIWGEKNLAWIHVLFSLFILSSHQVEKRRLSKSTDGRCF